MIPKTIHYCWFGGNPKPALAEKCIKSWKKYCKGYEIIEWNENNFDISSAPLYVRQAYEAKRWAFVTDYVRLYAMVNYGGIYMDTDVEVVRKLDAFLTHDAFSGFENANSIPTGIMACCKDFPLFESLLNYYNDASFFNEDGTENHTTNVAIITNICLERGLVPNNTFQIIEGFALYPNDVFCPVDYLSGKLKKTRNTVAIHWFSGSWQTEKQHMQRKFNRENFKRSKRINTLHNITHIPNKITRKILGKNNYEKLKSLIKKK